MSTFLRKKVHPGDLAVGFSDLEMTWLFYCAGAATGQHKLNLMAAYVRPACSSLPICGLHSYFIVL